MGGNRCEHIRVGTIVTKLWELASTLRRSRSSHPFPRRTPWTVHVYRNSPPQTACARVGVRPARKGARPSNHRSSVHVSGGDPCHRLREDDYLAHSEDRVINAQSC